MATIFRDVLVAPLPAKPCFVADVSVNLLLTTLAVVSVPLDRKSVV